MLPIRRSVASPGTLDSSPGSSLRITLVDELIPIGRFSALTDLSPKALRIYHDNKLIEPAVVDRDSGYRYYSADQIDAAKTIAVLRRAGVRLSEIAAFLSDPTADRVTRWKAALRSELEDRLRVLDHIAASTTTKEEPPMIPIATASKLERAIPVLASLDLEATQQFYADRLGFRPVAAYPDYAISERDGVQIHFWLTDDRRNPENTSCRVDVNGIDALYQEMLDAGVVHPNGPLVDQPWGMREFAILDGDGNLIKFAQQTTR